MTETLRVNGTATLSRNRELCESFAVRGRLWDPSTYLPLTDLPQRERCWPMPPGEEGGDAHDRALPERIRTTLY